MKKKKNEKDIIRIDDNNIDEKIEIKKDNIKDLKIEICKEENNKSEIKKIKKTNKIEKTIENNDNDEIKNKKSNLNILLLIITLIIVITCCGKLILDFDFSNLVITDLIKTFSPPLISLLIILILFKVNNKSTTPYIFILTIVLISYSLFNISYSKSDEYVVDFINKDVVEVIEWASSNNIELIELHEYSDIVLKNHIIMQEYGINTLVSDIKSLTITISDGPNYDKEIIVPNMIGFKYDDIMKYIKENHLNNVNIEFVESDKEKDSIIEQIGNGSLKRNSEIKFIFSKGLEDEKVSVVDLKGLSLFEATSYLKRYSILYEIKYEYSDEIEKNHVISQDIVNQVVNDKLTLVSIVSEITVPDLKKMTSYEIAKWAFSNNIKIKYLEEYNKEMESGQIISVDKQVNDKISEDSTITITLSKGSMIMPKVESLADFKLWANENNIKYEEVYEFSNNYPNGKIIKTSPEENTKIIETDTIVITISKGKSVTIPNLVGLSKANIVSKCNSLNLSCTFNYGGYTESTKKDISLKQSKKSGSIVSEGTNLLIPLSSGIHEKVNVPSFVGKTISQIQSSCNSLGVTCKFTYNNTYSNEDKDIAIKQDKTGTVIKGSTINVTLSIGPAKTYTVVIDGSLLTLGNPEQTKKTLQSKLENACPGVKFTFTFQAVNSGIGYLNPNSDVKVGSNKLVQGKTYKVIINSSN